MRSMFVRCGGVKPASSARGASSETGVPSRSDIRRCRRRSEACEGLFAREAAKMAKERFYMGCAGGDDADVDFGYSP